MTRTGLIDVYDLSDDGRLEPKYYLGGRIIDSLFSRKPRIGDQFLLSFQGSWALTASAGSRIDSWNVRSHQTRFRKRAESGIAALSPSGERIAVLVQHKAVDILDAKTGSTVASVMLGFSVDTLAVSDDGAVLAYTRQTEAEEPRPCRVDVWDVKDGKKRSELGGHGDKITSLEFCNNANMLVTGSLDRTVKLWDLKTGNARSIGPLEFETRAFPNREGTYCAVVVGPHMLDLYSITRDGTRRAWRDVWRTVSE
jgi:WD40 repeat protein